MSFADIQDKTTIFDVFSPADKAAILDAMQTAYEDSATVREMFNKWIKDNSDKKSLSKL
jgi:hypothetical protein